MKLPIYLFVAMLLAGCATPAELAAQREREMEAMMQTFGPACERLGYKNDSDPWRDCVLRLNAQESYERRQASPYMTSCFGNRGFYQCMMF